ncbi:MAG: hypothetical protein K2M92_00295, partial [Bacteroidales bacterium]|nr:hypothetical protein [Bacteroidales bacterium]
VVDDPSDAQGIIFAVAPSGDSAYLVAFTDLMAQRDLLYEDTIINGEDTIYNLHINYTFYANPIAWSEKLFECGATDKDGRVNTDRIIKMATDSAYGATAAQECRNYFKRSYRDTVEQSTYNRDTKWASTKGQWYLPSMEELAALMKVRDRINQRYLLGTPASDAANRIYFQAIGDKPNLDIQGKDAVFAYWSSTEHGKQYAWYDLPASNDDNYVPKTWSDEGGEGRIYVRPIRKVAL